MSGVRVLVVDDEPIVREVVCTYLRRDGHATVEAGDGEQALHLLASERFDLVVLDVMVPGVDGLEICRRVRAGSDLPVILLTARVEVLRRTVPAPSGERLVFGDLAIEPSARQVTKAGTELRFTAREFDLLLFLARNPRQVFSRQHLMERVWGYQAAYDTGTVTVHIRRLREKIEDDPSHPKRLVTVWGVGYRFEP